MDIFGQFRHKKCAADNEKTLTHNSTFTRCIPKTAQAKGLFETKTKEKNLASKNNLRGKKYKITLNKIFYEGK